MNVKHNILLITLLMGANLLFSCTKKKEQSEDIVVEKVVAKPQKTISNMPKDHLEGNITWGGIKYIYKINRTVNETLPTVTNHNIKYHDNEITVNILRVDGSEFFKKTYTKSNFTNVLPTISNKTGVLLGINFLKVENNNLHFIVSVGAPDDNYEEFYYTQLVIDNTGATHLEEYTATDI